MDEKGGGGFEPFNHYIPLSASLTQTWTICSDSFYFHNTKPYEFVN